MNTLNNFMITHFTGVVTVYHFVSRTATHSFLQRQMNLFIMHKTDGQSNFLKQDTNLQLFSFFPGPGMCWKENLNLVVYSTEYLTLVDEVAWIFDGTTWLCNISGNVRLLTMKNISWYNTKGDLGCPCEPPSELMQFVLSAPVWD